jgi:hypothetical protein
MSTHALATFLLPALLLAACGDKDGDDTAAADDSGADADTDTDTDDDTDDDTDAGTDDDTDADTDDDTDSGTDTEPVDADGDGVVEADDCDDADPDVGGPATWYTDADGDGHGDAAAPVDACEMTSGLVDNADDCDDSSALALPGGTESCDNLDNDCNGTTDDGGWLGVPADHADIDTAIAAATSGDTICVAEGTHDGFTAASTNLIVIGAAGSEGTILDAEGLRRNIDLNGVTLDITGFTLRNGVVVTGNRGSAIFGNGGLFTASDIVIDDTDAGTTYLQGVVGFTNGRLDIDGLRITGLDVETDSEIEGVIALSGVSGTMRNVSITDNQLVAGSTIYGGLMALGGNLVVEDLDIIGNTYTASRTSCSGIHLQQSSGMMDATRVRILDNESLGSSSSGGEICASYYTELSVQNLIVANTTASEYNAMAPLVVGGPDATLTVENATIRGLDNVYGGLVHSWGTGENAYELTNIIVSSTHSDLGALQNHRPNDTSDETLSHVMWHDVTSDDGQPRSGTTTGTITQTAVAEGDPAFVDTTAADAIDWDLSLSSGSAAIDAGDPDILDVDGTRSDLGAFGGPGAW